MRILVYTLLIASCVIAVGCDPVRTTQQSFRLRVTDSTSGSPIVNARVLTKYDFDRGEAASLESRRLSEEMRQQARTFWEESPWHSGFTDQSGEVSITIERTALDRTSGTKPPSKRDITGEPYLVLVRKNAAHDPKESLSILMKPGELVRDNSMTVTVVEIREPVYVETK